MLSTSGNVFNGLIEQKLLNLHTAFFAKVISVNGNKAKIQPLNMIKATGQAAQRQSAMTVPILGNVKKIRDKTVRITIAGTEYSFTVPEAYGVAAGDTVYCLCSERSITETQKGSYSIPTAGHHRISDAVIVGIV